MIALYIVLLILVAHFVADFIFQSDYHAVNKSKSNFVLAQHVLIYSAILTLFGLLFPISLAWIVFNCVGHFITDWCTSRATSRLWVANQRHWFFVVIGLDQLIHYTMLFVSYQLLVNVQ
jgi:hypothetical protein